MTGPLLLHIDFPEDRVLRGAMCRVRGWCACNDSSLMRDLELKFGDAWISWQSENRSDVGAENPDRWVIGFNFDLDISQYLYAIKAGELRFRAVLSDAEVGLTFFIAPDVTACCLAAAAGV
jgi:hypothetical protein